MAEYYVTLCEFYLKNRTADYIGNSHPTGAVDAFHSLTDENGDEYEIFHEYQHCEYNLIACIGELSNDALQLFQENICRRGFIQFFEHNRCISIVTRIVCCTVGEKPQWNGDNSMTFPHKHIVKRKPREGVNYDRNIHVDIAIWLREYSKTSLRERRDLDRKLEYGNSLLHSTETTTLEPFDAFCRQVLKICIYEASAIRKAEAGMKCESKNGMDDVPADVSRRFNQIPEAAGPIVSIDKKTPKAKVLQSLDDVIRDLPPYPTYEQENDDWILATRFEKPKPRSLNTMRSNQPKYNNVGSGIVSMDSSGRVYWKPEIDSQKIFYCKKYLKGDETFRPDSPPTCTTKRKK